MIVVLYIKKKKKGLIQVLFDEYSLVVVHDQPVIICWCHMN